MPSLSNRAEPERPLRVATVGATGYAGTLTSTLVEGHPWMTLSAVTSEESAGRPLYEVCPESDLDLKLERFDADRIADGADVAMVGYPSGEAAPVVAELRERDLPVVDFSGDNRLSAERYARYYGGEAVPELLAEAVYGLTELHREEIREAELVANPGCYATAAILALAPLRGRIAEVIVDGKSGVSGAGRKAATAPDSKPYRPSGHPHIGELEQELGEGIPITFVPHLSPEHQGLLVSCYVRPVGELTQADLDELYRDAYADERFVRVLAKPPSVNAVKYTNQCHVHAKVNPDTGLIMAFGAIDNLWKGAAGQAIQNLNVMLGYDESGGLR